MDDKLSLGFGIILSVMVFLVVIMALVPYYTRRTVAFGIAVPEDAYHDPYLTKLRRKYLAACLVGGAIVLTLCSVLVSQLGTKDWWWAMILSMFAFLGLSLIVYLRDYRLVKKYKQQSNWKIEPEQAEVPTEGAPVKKPLHAAWYLVYVAVIAAMSIVTAVMYSSLPSQLPMHYDVSGAVDRYVTKTPLHASTMLLVMVFIGLLFYGLYYAVTRAKRQGDYHRDSVFRSAMSKALFLIGLLALLLLTAVQLSILGVIQTQWMIAFPLVFIILIFVILITIAVTVGQGGSRVKGGAKGKRDVAEDDSHWVWGIFYKNKNDHSIFVERRFGFGYTLNIANPVSIIIIIAFALAIVTIVSLAINATSS